MGKTCWFGNCGIIPNLQLRWLYFFVLIADRMTVSEQVSSRLVQKKSIGRPISEFCVLTAARRIGLSEAVSKGKVWIQVFSSIALNILIQIWSIPLTVEMPLWWEALISIQALLWWRTEMGIPPKHRVCWHTRQSAIFGPKAGNKVNENHTAEPHLAYTALVKCYVQSWSLSTTLLTFTWVPLPQLSSIETDIDPAVLPSERRVGYFASEQHDTLRSNVSSSTRTV